MNHRLRQLLFFILFLLLNFNRADAQEIYQQKDCLLNDQLISQAIQKIAANKNLAKNLPPCLKSNYDFIAELIEFNYKYFEGAGDDIKDDDNFISYFITKYPGILEFISPRLKKDSKFFFRAVDLTANALKYADYDLVDNKLFMKSLIEKNPQYYAFASDRLHNDYSLTLFAVINNGQMLKFASSELQANRTIALAAVSSYTPAINFIDPSIKKDPKIRKISSAYNYNYLNDLNFYLKENYGGLPVGPKGNRGYRIVNRGKFYIDHQTIKHPDLTRWEVIYKDGREINQYKIAPNKEDYGWKDDLKNYPQLVEQIKKFLKYNHIDANTVNAMNVSALWTISEKPKVLAFNLYLLRNLSHKYLKPNSVNITSLTFIAKQNKNKRHDWNITMVNSILDVNIEMDMNFKGGYKKFRIWDLYKSSDKDKDFKILFRVEDEDSEYFQLYAPQPNGKYAMIFEGGGYSNW